MAAAVPQPQGGLMLQDGGLVLRDIHAIPAPGWWPPAPGWWWLAAAVFLGLGVAAARHAWRVRRRRRVARVFDDALAAAATPAAEVAAMSALLRRAARRRDPAAAALRGGEWLAFLDAGAPVPQFDGAVGRLLVEGGFRRDVDADAVAALRRAARSRFLSWMDPR